VIAGNLAPPAERPDTDVAPGLIELRSPPGCASGAESRINTENRNDRIRRPARKSGTQMDTSKNLGERGVI
jgi:hypothetical protein